MRKVLLVDAISFRADPNDEIWNYENVAQIKYAEAQNRVITDYLGKNVEANMHNQIEYISNQGLLMLGYLLKQNGIFVSYTNGDYFDSENDFISDIKTNYTDYDVYCFTSTTPQFNHVRRLAQAIKSMNNNAKTVLGGPHTRFFLTNDKDVTFDYIVTGYGIDKTVELIKKLLKGESEEIWRIDTDMYYDCPKDYSLIPEGKRMNTLWYNFFGIGCPNRCKYCVEHKVGKRICFSNVNSRIDEVEYIIKNYGVKMFHFSDSDFFINELVYTEVIEEIERRNINCTFTVNTSPGFLIKVARKPILKKFVKNGLIEILIGAEHFSESVRNKVSKYYDMMAFMEALDIVKHEVGVPIISLYSMVGLPFEYNEDIKTNVDTFKKMREMDLFDFTFPKFFVPYPDSDIFMYPYKYRVVITSDNFDDYHRWRTPRPVRIIGMDDQLYIQEILDIIRTNKGFNENEVRNEITNNKFFI